MNARLLSGIIILAVAAGGVAALLLVARPATNRSVRGTMPHEQVDLPAIRARAQAGDATAELQLGRLYARGEGVPISYRDAAAWFEKAVAKTNAEAEFALGELFDAGQGEPQDTAKAIQLYRRAAEQDCAGAQYALGFAYEAGHGVPQDHVQASQWYRRAAENGEPLAQYDLGQRYDLGVGVPVDRVEAYKWLALASAQGQPDSIERLKKVETKMSRDEIKEAKRRVAEFVVQKKPHAGNSTVRRMPSIEYVTQISTHLLLPALRTGQTLPASRRTSGEIESAVCQLKGA